MLKTDKKGQSLGGLYGGILTIASIGILLALLIFIFTSMGNSFKAQDTAGAVINETGAYINTTGYTLGEAGAEDFAIPVITAAYNATDDTSIGTGNITVSSTGVITNATATNWDDVIISYTYTYTADTESSNATTTLTTQFVDFLPWLGIILLVLAAGVVLFFVIRSFAGGSRGV